MRGTKMFFERANSAPRKPTMHAKRARPILNVVELESRVLLSTWYVANAGSDSAVGSLTAPFQTIGHAAAIAQPGDSVLVRAGTYRETVIPTNSGNAGAPITYAAYNNEKVVLDGSDPMTGWTQFKGNIYRAPMSWNLGNGANQVFVDSQAMTEARWPNLGSDPSHPNKEIASLISATSSTATITDSALAAGWGGATIHIASGEGWVEQPGTVSTSNAGSLTFNYTRRILGTSAKYETPRDGDPYYLTGRFQALDSAKEWYRDQTDGQLYLWTPAGDNPANHIVEAKRRQYAFDLGGKAYIYVKGFTLLGCTITSDTNSRNLWLDKLTGSYLTQAQNPSTGWLSTFGGGIYLGGTDSIISNSTISFTSQSAIILAGAGNRAINNTVHDVDLSATSAAGIMAAGSDLIISYNTVYNTGREGINFSNSPGAKVTHNLVHDAMLQSSDGGGIYTFGTDAQGGEVAYNIVYNVHGGGFGGAGLYLDNSSANWLVHHNVSWSCDYAMKTNTPSLNNQIFNNTLIGDTNSLNHGGNYIATGTVVRNNIFNAGVDIGPGATQDHNLFSAPAFVSAAGHDYRLAAGSAAIDKGAVIAPYTNGYTGSAPDIGAYEYGVTPWTAGSSTTARDPFANLPATPSGLTLTSGSNGITLKWNSTGAALYHVYAGLSAFGPFTRLDGGALTATQYVESGPPSGVTRYYRVTAVDKSGNESFAIAGSFGMAGESSAATVPNGLAAVRSTINTTSEIDLHWNATTDASYYRVQRSVNGGPFKELINTKTFYAFYDSSLAPGTSYTYRVVAVNGSGISTPSGISTATTAGVPLSTQGPAAPTNITAAAVLATQVYVRWSAVSGASSYSVLRKGPGEVSFVTLASNITNVGYTPTAYVDSGLIPGSNYQYEVAANSSSAAGVPSSPVPVSTPTVQSFYKTNIAATPAGSTTVVTDGKDYDITAGGTGLGGLNDSARVSINTTTGDFDLKVRIAALTAPTSNAQAGLVARVSLDTNGRSVFIGITPNGWTFVTRTAGGSNATTAFYAKASSLPNAWVRLQRIGNNFTGFFGTDGQIWQQVGYTTIASTPALLYVGMAAASGSSTATASVQFRGASFISHSTTQTATSTLQAESATAISLATVYGSIVGGVHDHAVIKFADVNFGSNASKFMSRIALDNTYAGARIELHLDSVAGTTAGAFTTVGTGGWNSYNTQSAGVSGLSGVHDIYIVFNGKDGAANVDWFNFS